MRLDTRRSQEKGRRPVARSCLALVLAVLALTARGGAGAEVDLATAPGFRITGPTAGDGAAGMSVAPAGDVNADGRPDVIVGLAAADPLGRAGAGAAYVVFGRRGLATVDLGSLGVGGFRVAGAAAGDAAGTRVAGAGDVNGDGRADIVIGAPGADHAGRVDAGAGYVVFGTSSTAGVDLAALGGSGFRIDGAAAGDRAGASVARAGDQDGDGMDDIALGAPGASPSGAGSGAAYVVLGRAATSAVDLASLQTAAYRIRGAAAGDAAGTDVAPAGDVDGDGRPDVVVGAPGADPQARSGAGSAYVVPGQRIAAPGTTVALASLASPGVRVDGATAGDGLGTAVAGAGDLDGDGRADLVLGAPGADPAGRAGAGSAHLVVLTPGVGAVDLAVPGAGLHVGGAAAGDALGTAVAGAGDLDGDGRPDVLVGAPGADPHGRAGAGSAYAVRGRTSGIGVDLAALAAADGFAVSGAVAGDGAGHGVAVLGDVDADGRPELAAAAPGAGSAGLEGAGVAAAESLSAGLPAAATGEADLTADGVRLTGHAGPEGRAATWWFEYGPTTGYGQTTPPIALDPGVTPVAVEATVGSPGPGATLHARLVVRDAEGHTARGADQAVAGGWYAAGWRRRRAVVAAPAPAGALADFPLLVRLTDPALAGRVQGDADDVLLTAADGTTRLAHEVERYDATTGELVVWVKVPELSASGTTTLFLYYDNPAAASQEQAAQVWSNGYALVHHYGESTHCGPFRDSSGNGNDAACAAGASPASAAAQIGRGLVFDGVDDHLTVAASPSLDALGDVFTVQAWVRRASPGTWDTVWTNGDNAGAWGLQIADAAWGEGPDLYIEGSGDYVGPTRIIAPRDHLVSASHSAAVTGQNTFVHLDGLLETATLTGPVGPPSGVKLVGAWKGGIDHLPGVLDELRLSNVVRSVAWLRAEAVSQAPGSDFTRFAPEQRTDPVAPSAPAVAGGSLAWRRGPVTLSAAGVDDAGGFGITGYEHRTSADGGETWSTPAAGDEVTVSADGETRVQFRSVDGGGNRSSWAPAPGAAAGTVRIDAVAPSTPAVGGGSAAWQSVGSVTLTGSGSSDARTGVAGYEHRTSADGGAGWTDPAAGATAVVGAEGETMVQMRAVDGVGNRSAWSPDPGAAPAMARIDRTPPAVPAGLAAPSPTTAPPALTWGAVAGASIYRVLRDGSPVAEVAVPAFTEPALPPFATHAYRVVAVDAAGNASAAAGPIGVEVVPVDTTPPDTTITAGPSGPTRDAGPALAFTDDGSGTGYECRLDPGAWTGCTSPWRPGPLADGDHAAQVRAFDAAGNRDPSPAVRAFTVDTVAPDPPVVSAAGDPTVALSSGLGRVRIQVTGDAGTTRVLVRRGATTVHDGAAGEVVDDGLADSAIHAYTVTAFDAAGNASLPVATAAATPDRTPPGAASVPVGGGSPVALTWPALAGATGYVVRVGEREHPTPARALTDPTAVDLAAPAPPAGLRARTGPAGTIAVAWTAPEDAATPYPAQVRGLDDEGNAGPWSPTAAVEARSGVAGYRVLADGRTVAETTATEAAVAPPAPGAAQEIRIVAVDRAGNGSVPSAPLLVRTEPAPPPASAPLPDQTAPAPLRVRVAATPAVVRPGIPVVFTASVEGADIGSAVWRFPGGTSARGARATLAFAAPGVQQVDVEVTATDGRTGSASVTVVADAAPPTIRLVRAGRRVRLVVSDDRSGIASVQVATGTGRLRPMRGGLVVLPAAGGVVRVRARDAAGNVRALTRRYQRAR